MQDSEFTKQWKKAMAVLDHDRRAVADALRKAEVDAYFDGIGGIGFAEREQRRFDERGGESPAALSAMRMAASLVMLRRRFLWAECAACIERLEESFHSELRSSLRLAQPSGDVDERAQAADDAAASEIAGAESASLAAAAGMPAEASGAPDVGPGGLGADDGIERCRQRLLAMRERNRAAMAAASIHERGERRTWKFGRPRPLESRGED